MFPTGINNPEIFRNPINQLQAQLDQNLLPPPETRYYRELPETDFYHYHVLFNAAYIKDKDEIQAYVSAESPGTKVKDIYEYRCWKFVLFELNDKLYIGCRGTDNNNLLTSLSNWNDNFRHGLGDYDLPALREMNQHFSRWESEYNRPIYGIAGHSGGGYWASRIMAHRQNIYRVTSNGNFTPASEYHINVRTTDDFVSLLPIGSLNDRITIAGGGHGAANTSSTKYASWNALGIYQIDHGYSPPTPSTITSNQNFDPVFPSPQRLKINLIPDNSHQRAAALLGEIKMKELSSAASPANVPTFERTDSIIYTADEINNRIIEPLKQLNEQMCQLDRELVDSTKVNFHATSATDLTEVGAKYEDCYQTGLKLLEASKIISQEMYALCQREMKESNLRFFVREMEHEYTINKKNLISAHQNHIRGIENLYSSLIDLHPSKAESDFRELTKQRKKINSNVAKLVESLKAKNKFIGVIDISLMEIDKTDKTLTSLHRKILRKQANARATVGFIKTSINLATAVLACTPAAALAVPINMAVTAGFGVLEMGDEEKSRGAQSRYKEEMRKNQESRSNLYQEKQLLEESKARLEHAQSEHWQDLIENPDKFEPLDHQDKLMKAEADLNTKKESLNAKSEALSKALADKKNLIRSLEDQIANEVKKVTESCKKDKKGRISEKQNDKNQKEIANRTRSTQIDLARTRAELISLETASHSLKEVSSKIDEEEKGLQKAYDEAKRFESLRLLKEKLILRPLLTEDQEAIKNVCDEGFKSYSDFYLPYRKVTAACLDLAKSTQNPSLILGAEVATNGIKALELGSYLHGVALPLVTSYFSPEDNPTKKITLNLFLTGVVTPFIGLSAALVGIGVAVYLQQKMVQKNNAPTEFEQTVYNFNALAKKFEVELKKFAGVSDAQHQEIISEFSNIRFCLNALESDINLTIKNKFEKTTKIALTQNFSDLQDKISNINNEIRDTFNELKERKFASFSNKFNSLAKKIKSSNISGYLIGSEQRIEILPTSLLSFKPVITTGIIAFTLFNKDKMPNWLLLEKLSKAFLHSFTPEFIKQLETNPKLLSSVEDKCISLQKSQNQFLEFFNLQTSLDNLVKRNQATYRRIKERAQECRDMKAKNENDLLSRDLILFSSSKNFKKEFMGSKRYYIYDLCVKKTYVQPLFQLISAWALFPYEKEGHLDLNTRKITVERFRTSKSVPFGTITFIPLYLFISIFALLEYFFKRMNFSELKIHATYSPEFQKSFNKLIPLHSNHDEKIQLLYSEYCLLLDSHKNNTLLSSKNIFFPISKTSKLIRSKSQKTLPLAFPKSLIEHLSKLLGITQSYHEAAKNGYFIPFYDFCDKERKLFIGFDFTPLNPSSTFKNTQEYCRISVAEINQLTLDTFKYDLSSNDNCYALTEALILMLYADLQKLGMPNKESIVTTNGLIAPNDTPFIGLYALWEKLILENSKNISIIFDSNTFDKDDIGINYRALSLRYTPFSSQILKEAFIAKDKVMRKEKLFEKEYRLFEALAKLFSNHSQNYINSMLLTELEIFPPENLGLLVNSWISNRVPKAPSVENYQRIVESLNSRPSLTLKKFNHFRKNLAIILTSLQSFKERRNISTPDVKDLELYISTEPTPISEAAAAAAAPI